MEKGEQGRLRPRDPRAGLSHACSSLADPNPLPQRPGAGSALPMGYRAEGRRGEGGSTRQAARAAPVPMVTGWSLSSKEGGVPLSAGTAPARRGSPRALRQGATSFRSGRKGLTAAPSQVSPAPKAWGGGGAMPPRAQPPRPPTHKRTQLAHPPRARTHDRVGLHACSDPRRVSRHARRTRPRSAGRGPSERRAAGRGAFGAHCAHLRLR